MISELDSGRSEASGRSAKENITTEWLRAGDLKFDHEHYQRLPNEATISRIAERWDEGALHTIVVSRRADGTLWVIDGQQRTLGTIRRWGMDIRIKAEVFEEITPRREAELFAEYNAERRVVHTLLRYRAWWESGDPEVRAIADLLEDLRITYSWQGSDQDRVIICWVAMHKLVRKTSIDHLRIVLEFIEDAWQCERHSLEGHFVTGMSLLLRRHSKDEGWDRAGAIQSFGRVPAMEILKYGRELRLSQTVESPNPATCVYHALHRTYNKGRRTRRLEEVYRRGGAG